MAFTVVEGEGRTLWCATDGASTYYMGQIVSLEFTTKALFVGAVKPLAVPVGIADLTNFQIPFGVIVGFNDRNPTFATVGSKSIQYANAVPSSAEQVTRIGNGITGGGGMYGQDPQLLVQITEITPNTIIRGPFYNNAYGTAISELTHTSVADTTGMATAGAVLDACNFTPVTLLATIYCREGKNRGLYRTTVDTNTTTPDLTTAFPYNSAIGDKYVRVPAKQGLSYIYISGPGLYVNASLGLVTNYFNVICYKLNLEVAGQEYMEFRFLNMHFDNRRHDA